MLSSIQSAGRGRATQQLVAAALLLLANTAPASAGGLLDEPCHATCGSYKWFLNHSRVVRENAQCCLSHIYLAKKKEERALDLFEASREPGLESWERNDLRREGNRMIGQRGRKISRFIDCVNGVGSALNMKKRGLDPMAEYAAACGVALLCEEDQ